MIFPFGVKISKSTIRSTKDLIRFIPSLSLLHFEGLLKFMIFTFEKETACSAGTIKPISPTTGKAMKSPPLPNGFRLTTPISFSTLSI